MHSANNAASVNFVDASSNLRSQCTVADVPEETSALIYRKIRENRHNIHEESKNNIETMVSKFRIFASQMIATLAVSLLKFTTGNTMGFTTIFIGELAKENAEITVTLDELTWYSSYFFLVPFGSLVGGFITQRSGSRSIFIISAIIYIASWLMYHWSTTSEMILCAQVLIGLANGILSAPSLTHIAEITQPHLRSTFMSTSILFYLSGQFFTILLGGYMYWRTIALVNLIFPIIALIMCSFIPNSPPWLASKNRINDARKSLAWYRGWVNPNAIESEIETMKSILNTTLNSSANASNNGNAHNYYTITGLKNILKPYLNRTFYIPLATSCYIFFINTFGGSHSVQVFSAVIFTKIRSPIEVHTATIILNAARTIGAISCLFTIRLVGKRKLLFFSVIGGGISFASAAIFNLLINSNYLVSSEYLWIPTISVILAVFIIAAGIDKIMHLLNSEIFPLSHRLVGSGLGETFYNLILSAFNKIFLYLTEYITLSGIFAIFAITNIIGFITLYFIILETEGRTLNEIEEHYTGKRRLKKKQNNSKEKRITNDIDTLS